MTFQLRTVFLAAVLILLGTRLVWSEQSNTPAHRSGSVSPPFTLTASAVNDLVKVGSAVVLNVTVTNTSNHEISIWKANSKDQGGYVYKVNVKIEKDSSPRETTFGRRIRLHHGNLANITPDDYMVGASGAPLPLRPGKTRKDEVNVSRLYDLSQPGNYIVQVQLFDETTKIFVKSNNIMIKVIPE